MKQPQNIIEVTNLHKKFGTFSALDGLDLSVVKGEVHGFLGPNGSGKSTTIRILLGLLKKSEGNVTVLGQNPWDDAVKIHKDIAYVPGDVELWPQLTGGEVIDILGELNGGLNEAKRKILLERFQLDPRKKFRTYSKGNRQKVAIVAAFSSNAEVYILDEPTSGLDPLMEAAFQTCVEEVKEDGKTVLLSSHILAEVEALCDRVTIIKDGKTVETGTLSELQHLHHSAITVQTKKQLPDLGKIKGVHNLKLIDKNSATFELESAAFDEVMKKLSNLGITKLTSHPPALEELFLRHYQAEGK